MGLQSCDLDNHPSNNHEVDRLPVIILRSGSVL